MSVTQVSLVPRREEFELVSPRWLCVLGAGRQKYGWCLEFESGPLCVGCGERRSIAYLQPRLQHTYLRLLVACALLRASSSHGPDGLWLHVQLQRGTHHAPPGWWLGLPVTPLSSALCTLEVRSSGSSVRPVCVDFLSAVRTTFEIQIATLRVPRTHGAATNSHNGPTLVRSLERTNERWAEDSACQIVRRYEEMPFDFCRNTCDTSACTLVYCMSPNKTRLTML